MSKRTIFTVEEVVLLNGKTVTAKQLPLKKLKQANRIMRKLGDLGLTEEEEKEIDPEELNERREDLYLDQLIEIASLVVNFDPVLEKDADGAAVEEVADVLDSDTAYRIIEVGTGVKLNDENLIKMAAEMAANQAA